MDSIYQLFTGQYIDISKIVSVSAPDLDPANFSFQIISQLTGPITVNYRPKSALGRYNHGWNINSVIEHMGYNEPYTTQERFRKLVEEKEKQEIEMFSAHYNQFINDWKNFNQQP